MCAKPVFPLMSVLTNSDFFYKTYKESVNRKAVNLEGLVSLGYYSMFTCFYPNFENIVTSFSKCINYEQFDNCTVCV
ncbi:hypothetical protein NMT12_100020 [metagenome]